MENPHVACLRNLFEEYQLMCGTISEPISGNFDKKNILVIVDKSIASTDLQEVTRFFFNKAIVKCVYIINLDKGNNFK